MPEYGVSVAGVRIRKGERHVFQLVEGCLEDGCRSERVFGIEMRLRFGAGRQSEGSKELRY